MRTVCSGSRLEGCLLWGGLLWRGIYSQGVCSRGVSAPRGVCYRDVCSWGGVVSQHALRQTPFPVDRMTDMCKNVTFATSLQTVKMESHTVRPSLDSLWRAGARRVNKSFEFIHFEVKSNLSNEWNQKVYQYDFTGNNRLKVFMAAKLNTLTSNIWLNFKNWKT